MVYPKKKKGSSQRGSGNSAPSHLNDSPFAISIPQNPEMSTPMAKKVTLSAKRRQICFIGRWRRLVWVAFLRIPRHRRRLKTKANRKSMVKAERAVANHMYFCLFYMALWHLNKKPRLSISILLLTDALSLSPNALTGRKFPSDVFSRIRFRSSLPLPVLLPVGTRCVKLAFSARFM